MINKHPPVSRYYNRDPDIQALKGSGCISHGSTLQLLNCKMWALALNLAGHCSIMVLALKFFLGRLVGACQKGMPGGEC